MSSVNHKRKFKKSKRDEFLRDIDKLSYQFFIWIYIIGTIVFAIIYKLLSLYKVGINYTGDNVEKIISFMDSIYFSILTITTLGTGDFKAVSFGKLVVSIEVFFGLIIFTILLSKLASERTSNLIKLIYTSDVQSRLNQELLKFEKYTFELESAIESHDYIKIHEVIEDCGRDFSLGNGFLTFHYNEGDLNGRWAQKSYLKIIKELEKSLNHILFISRLIKLTDQEKKSCVYALRQASYFLKSINDYLNDTQITKIYKSILSKENATKIQKNDNSLTKMSPEILNKIKDELPKKKVYEKSDYQRIQSKFRLSSSFLSKAMKEINKK